MRPEPPIPGQTSLDDLSGLRIRSIRTTAELNAAEAENIRKATMKYLASRPSPRSARFDIPWLRRLHAEMFGDVWSWAGTFRTHETNIGAPPHDIEVRLHSLLEDLKVWKDSGMPLLEQAVRLHHVAVHIHPFPNGNGRWSRMAGNIWLKLHRAEPIEWPETTIGSASTVRGEYLEAVRRADKRDYAALVALHERFASRRGGVGLRAMPRAPLCASGVHGRFGRGFGLQECCCYRLSEKRICLSDGCADLPMSESQILYSDTPMDSAQAQIHDRILQASPGTVFTPKDFLDLASRDATDQALSRLVRQAQLRRLGRGLYYTPRRNETLGVDVPPDLDDVADAVARQTGSRVAPSGAVAANRLGLSTQVPAKPVYLSDGRTRQVVVGNYTLQIKHVSPKDLPVGSRTSALVLQALRFLGKDAIHDRTVAVVRSALSRDDRAQLLRDAQYATDWLREIARRVAAEKETVANG